MIVQNVIHGNTVENALHQDYESILSEASATLSEAEFKHLTDIANIGYQYATRKYDYVETINETISEWVAEERRAELHFPHSSTVIDFGIWYNDAEEVKNQMESTQGFNVIPALFVCFGAVVLALFCISATILVIGLCQKTFFINPVYLFMLTVGFLGLLFTDIAAIVEWRKGQNVQKQREA